MSRHECDCGVVYHNLEALYACQGNNHYQPVFCNWERREVVGESQGRRYWWTGCETMTKSQHGPYCHNCGKPIKKQYLPKRAS